MCSEAAPPATSSEYRSKLREVLRGGGAGADPSLEAIALLSSHLKPRSLRYRYHLLDELIDELKPIEEGLAFWRFVERKQLECPSIKQYHGYIDSLRDAFASSDEKRAISEGNLARLDDALAPLKDKVVQWKSAHDAADADRMHDFDKDSITALLQALEKIESDATEGYYISSVRLRGCSLQILVETLASLSDACLSCAIPGRLARYPLDTFIEVLRTRCVDPRSPTLFEMAEYAHELLEENFVPVEELDSETPMGDCGICHNTRLLLYCGNRGEGAAVACQFGICGTCAATLKDIDFRCAGCRRPISNAKIRDASAIGQCGRLGREGALSKRDTLNKVRHRPQATPEYLPPAQPGPPRDSLPPLSQSPADSDEPDA